MQVVAKVLSAVMQIFFFAFRFNRCFVASGKGQFRECPRAQIILLSKKGENSCSLVLLSACLAALLVFDNRSQPTFFVGTVNKGQACLFHLFILAARFPLPFKVSIKL